MISRIRRDVFRRIFFYSEKRVLYNKFLSQRPMVFKIRKQMGFGMLKNLCLVSNSSRAVFSWFRVSRIAFRKHTLSGKISNCIVKQSW